MSQLSTNSYTYIFLLSAAIRSRSNLKSVLVEVMQEKASQKQRRVVSTFFANINSFSKPYFNKLPGQMLITCKALIKVEEGYFDQIKLTNYN